MENGVKDGKGSATGGVVIAIVSRCLRAIGGVRLETWVAGGEHGERQLRVDDSMGWAGLGWVEHCTDLLLLTAEHPSVVSPILHERVEARAEA